MHTRTLTLGIEGGELFPEPGTETTVIQRGSSQYVTSFNSKELTSLHEVLYALTRYKGIVGNGEGTDKGVLTRRARSVDGITSDVHFQKYQDIAEQAENYLGEIRRYLVKGATESDLEQIAKQISAESTEESIMEKLSHLMERSKKTCEAIISINSSNTAGEIIYGEGLLPQIGRIKQEYKDLRTVAIAAVNNREYGIGLRNAPVLRVLRMLFTKYIDSVETLETCLAKLGYPELERDIRERTSQNVSDVVTRIYSLDDSFKDALKTLSGVSIEETVLGTKIECTIPPSDMRQNKTKVTTILDNLSLDADGQPPVDVVDMYTAVKEIADEIIEKIMAEGLASNTYGIATVNE